MVVLWRGSEKSRRAGFTVARQIRGSVSRNRARRRLREAYRRARQEAPEKVDLIVIGRPKTLALTMNALIEDMCAAFRSMAYTQERT
jgi:ribonuclease P protein component